MMHVYVWYGKTYTGFYYESYAYCMKWHAQIYVLCIDVEDQYNVEYTYI